MARFEVPTQVSDDRPAAPAGRSVRRATARRASSRRASARRRHRDDEASIIGFIANHPKSTVGDLARSLNLDAGHVAARLTQLTSTGEIHKAMDGYSASTPPREKRSAAAGVIRVSD
jgi:hypothetical protein